MNAPAHLLRSLSLAITLVVLPAGFASSLEIPPSSTAFIWDNNLDGAGDGNADSPKVIYVGELPQPNRKLTRGWITFALPAPPPGQSLVSAKLVIGVLSNLGVSKDLILYHGRDDNGTVNEYNSRYQSARYSNTALVVATPKTEEKKRVELDVTQWVKLDLKHDPSHERVSGFRLQVDGAPALQDGAGHVYALAAQGNQNLPAPVLILTYQ